MTAVEFFGLGFGEILLVIVIALIIFGPEKVPEMARTLGRMLRTIRQAASGFTTVITQELDEAKKTTSDLTAGVTQELDEVKKATSDLTTGLNKELSGVRKTTSDLTTGLNKEFAKEDGSMPPSQASSGAKPQTSANAHAESGGAEEDGSIDKRGLSDKNA